MEVRVWPFCKQVVAQGPVSPPCGEAEVLWMIPLGGSAGLWSCHHLQTTSFPLNGILHKDIFKNSKQWQWAQWAHYLLCFQNAVLQNIFIGQRYRGPLPNIQALILQITGPHIFRELDGGWNYNNEFNMNTIYENVEDFPCWWFSVNKPVRKLGMKRSSLSCWTRFLYPTYSAFFTSRKSWDSCSIMNKSSPLSRTSGASSLCSRTKRPISTTCSYQWCSNNHHPQTYTWFSSLSWLTSSTLAPPGSSPSSSSSFSVSVAFFCCFSFRSCGSGSKLKVKKLYASSAVGRPFPT